MNRRTAAIVATLAALAALVCVIYVLAEVPERSADRPLSVLIVRNPPALDAVEEHFLERMRELGYVEGENVQYSAVAVGVGIPETKASIATELDVRHIDLIYVMGVIAAKAAKALTDERGMDTPIVFGVVSDPVGVGLAHDIIRSGTNVTGITPANNITAAKRLEFLREMLPDTKRVIYVWNDEKTSGVTGLRAYAQMIGIELIDTQASTVQEMVSLLSENAYRPGDAMIRASDGVGAGALPEAIRIAKEKKVPLVGTNAGDTEKGALMSFGADYGDIGRASARLADLVLRGARPTDIPIEEASRYEVSVNLDTAREIGVVVPQQFLLKTNKIVGEY